MSPMCFSSSYAGITAAVCDLIFSVMSGEVACQAVALCEGWRHLKIFSGACSTSLRMTSIAIAMLYTTGEDLFPSLRLSPHDRVKISRVIRAADQRPRGDVEKTLPACDVPVVIELLRRDVFNHGQMFWTRAQV